MKNILDLFREANINIVYQTTVQGRGREFKGNCPICGGHDRLRIQPDIEPFGFFECRQCLDDFKGSAIDFCYKYLHIESFPKALEHIGAKTNFTEKPIQNIPKEPYKPTKIVRPTQNWIKEVTKITLDSHDYLLQAYEYDIKGSPTHKKKYSMQRDVMLYLLLRGITEDTIKEYKIGFNPEFINLTPNKKTIHVPPGITIPFYHHENFNQVLKLKIKSHIQGVKENPDHRFSITSEGQNGNSYLFRNTDNFIITESELDMYTLYSQLGSNFSYIATGNNLSLPDAYTYPIIKDCSTLLICHDNDAAGTTMYLRWKKEFKHAKPKPVTKGKDPGEAFQLKLNLKEFFESELNFIQVSGFQIQSLNGKTTDVKE